MATGNSQKTIIIIGMGKSGTSLISRIFQEWGAEMGKSIPSTYNNPEGYFENRQFKEFNEKLLAQENSSIFQPKEIKWTPKRGKEAEKIIEANKKIVWGWKDPRTLWTFNVYKRYLKNVLFVVCKRNKESVVNSYTDKLNKQKKDISNLYDQYYEKVKEVIKDYPTIYIHYEDLKNTKYFNPELKHF